MCLPLRRFFKAIYEFRKSIRELKSSLKYLREILSAVLKISRDLEDITKEVKNIVDFYSTESKGAIHSQLTDMMTSEGQDQLYYKEFIKDYKFSFDHWMTWFLSNHTFSKQSAMSVIEMIQRMRHTNNKLRMILHEDKVKTKVLEEINEFMYQTLQQYQQHIHTQNDSDDQKTVTENDTKLNIKIFCDKQKIISSLEESLSLHLGVTLASDAQAPEFEFVAETPQHYKSDTNHLVYRERATRIRKLRFYLSSKIKLKKIGEFYKEELSIQIQFDLEKAAKQLWDFERILNENTQCLVSALQQIPKQRFAEVLEENRLNEIQEIVNYVFNHPPDEIAPTIEAIADKLGVQRVIDRTTGKIKACGIDMLSDCLEKPQKDLEKVARCIDVREQNTSVVLEVLEVCLQKIKNKHDKYNDINELQSGRYIIAHNKSSNYGDKSSNYEDKIGEIPMSLSNIRFISYTKDELLELYNSNPLTTTNAIEGDTRVLSMELKDITLLPKIVSINSELVLSDIKFISTSAMKLMVQSSSKCFLAFMEKMLLETSDVINAISTVAVSVTDGNTESKENIFLKTGLQALLPGCHLEDIKFFTKLYTALNNSKENRKKFLGRIEESLSEKLLDEGKHVIEYFEKTEVDKILFKRIVERLTMQTN